MTEADGYTLEVATTQDEQRIIDFTRRFFSVDEPLTIAVDLMQGGERCTELETYCVQSLHEGTSLVALAPDGTMIGVCLNETKTRKCGEKKSSTPLGSPVGLPNVKFRNIARLLEHTEELADVFGHYPDINSYLDVKILSVDPAWRGRRMATKMINRTRDLAKSKGIPMVVCVATSHYTALAVERLEFQPIHELLYKDFVDKDGRVIFNTEAPHLSVKTYVTRV